MVRKFRLNILIFVSVLTLLGTTACRRNQEDRVQAAGEDRSTAVLSPADKHFMMEAEKANVDERAVGRLALQKSQNSEVRDYAQDLVDDHSKALENLVKLMQKQGVNQPSTLKESESQPVSKLQNLSGAEFDREFLSIMVKDHEKAIQKFQNEANTGQDKDVKDYASDMESTLQKHLDRAKELQSKLASGTNTTSKPAPAPNRKY